MTRTKHISVVIFSVLVYQMCVLERKKVKETFQSGTAARRRRDVNLNIFHKIDF